MDQANKTISISKEGEIDFQSVAKQLGDGMEQRMDAIQRAVALGMIKKWTCPECTFINQSYPSICEVRFYFKMI